MPLHLPFNFPFFYNNYKYQPVKNNSSLYNSKSFNTESPNSKIKDSKNNESSESFFEIFGIKLFFDDILIICLLLFLYNENVNDEELFVCLILLLLS